MFDNCNVVCYNDSGDKMEVLTKRQNDTLGAIKKFIAGKGYPPTVRELACILKLSSPATIQVHLDMLEKKGYIKKQGNRNRTIELLVDNEFKCSNDTTSIPLLGKITAGNPIEAIENPDNFLTIPNFLIPRKKEVFALNVNGESMINAGIFDNDIIIVEKTSIASNGDIVVAMNDDNEVTLKRFFKEKDHFRLQPENDYMEPIILNNISILGKAICLYRKF